MTGVYLGSRPYCGLRWAPQTHESVKHSVKEYVKGNGPTPTGLKAIGRCSSGRATEVTTISAEITFPVTLMNSAGRHNNGPLNTEEQMSKLVQAAEGKRLTCAALIGSVDTRQPRML